MALYEVFKEKGKRIRVIYSGIIPPDYRNYFNLGQVEQNIDPNSVDFEKYDLWISIDSGQIEHVSKSQDFNPPESLKILNIDHHSTNNFYGKLNYVDYDASSSSILVYRLFKEWQVEMKKELYKFLLLGILTDTGFFQYSNVHPEDLKMSVEAMENGVDMFKLIYGLTFNQTLDEIKFRMIVYRNIKFADDKEYAYTTISQKELKDENVDMLKVISKGSDLIKGLEGIKFTFSVEEKEDSPDNYSVSFRSHDMDVDISIYAKALGGGGHKVAAGGKVIANSMEEAKK
jgi:bifunctional oligoribonuclease and PAP phosphatase NrnA